eukprot:Amastigsp_a176762_80.p5 type:complete len:105 gc:universal Amastigsp_a176762_80:191-505(+)
MEQSASWRLLSSPSISRNSARRIARETRNTLRAARLHTRHDGLRAYSKVCTLSPPSAMYCAQFLSGGAVPVASLKASAAHAAATTAFVDAIAGMMFFMTPWVSW